MANVNIPNYDQWTKLNHYLNTIAVSLGSQKDNLTWREVQKIVQMGVAPDVFPIGTQFTVNHKVYGEKLYDVVAHNYFKKGFESTAPTMTLMCHDVLPGVQLDCAEAFYYADTDLPAGTYYFTINTTYNSWVAGTYKFTLTKTLPKGGQLCISGTSSSALTTLNVQAYESPTETSTTENVAITSGKSGTSLGTFGVELNHAHRVSYGSNNYKESAIRQFLNLHARDNWWSPQTKFDRPPSWVSSTETFRAGLVGDFDNVVSDVRVHCFANDTYESPDSTTTQGETYIVYDRYYLASQKEIFNTTNNESVESVMFPYYADATAIDRIKYRDGSPAYWWTRDPMPALANAMRIVLNDGSMNGRNTQNNYGFAPVCTIA